MLPGFALLFVGSVLFLNGLWILGKIGDNEISVINILIGTHTLIVALYWAFWPGADADSIKNGAFLLLFTFTYYWVAWNRWNGADGRGLGWFSFFVAVTCAPIAIETLTGARDVWGVWLGLSWVAWGVLWFMFFLLLVMKMPIGKIAGSLSVLEGILTGWLPGYLLLTKVMGPAAKAASGG